MQFKFDHTNKLYMHSPESVLVNETQKHIWDLEVQMDRRISAWTYINNNYKKTRTCRIVDFAVRADHKVKLKEC